MGDTVDAVAAMDLGWEPFGMLSQVFVACLSGTNEETLAASLPISPESQQTPRRGEIQETSFSRSTNFNDRIPSTRRNTLIMCPEDLSDIYTQYSLYPSLVYFEESDDDQYYCCSIFKYIYKKLSNFGWRSSSWSPSNWFHCADCESDGRREKKKIFDVTQSRLHVISEEICRAPPPTPVDMYPSPKRTSRDRLISYSDFYLTSNYAMKNFVDADVKGCGCEGEEYGVKPKFYGEPEMTLSFDNRTEEFHRFHYSASDENNVIQTYPEPGPSSRTLTPFIQHNAQHRKPKKKIVHFNDIETNEWNRRRNNPSSLYLSSSSEEDYECNVQTRSTKAEITPETFI